MPFKRKLSLVTVLLVVLAVGWIIVTRDEAPVPDPLFVAKFLRYEHNYAVIQLSNRSSFDLRYSCLLPSLSQTNGILAPGQRQEAQLAIPGMADRVLLVPNAMVIGFRSPSKLRLHYLRLLRLLGKQAHLESWSATVEMPAPQNQPWFQPPTP